MKIIREYNGVRTALEIPHQNLGETLTVSITDHYGEEAATVASIDLPKVLAAQLVAAVYQGMGLANPATTGPTYNVVL